MTLPAYCTTILALLALGSGCAHKSAPSPEAYDDAYRYDDVGMVDGGVGVESMAAAPMAPTVATTQTAPTSAPAMPAAVMGSVPSGSAAIETETSPSAEEAVVDPELPTIGADAVDQMLVFNGALSLMVEPDGIPDSIDAAVDQAVRAGGYIAQQTDTTLTLRVPSRRFRKVMHQIEGLGEVRSRSVQTIDVSEEFHDLRVRLDNLQATRTRIQKLLGQAKGLTEILTVEKELERVGAEIDRIQGRLRFLSSQAAFSTVTITFAELPREIQIVADDPRDTPPPPPPPPPHVLDTHVDWIGEVGVHGLMEIR